MRTVFLALTVLSGCCPTWAGALEDAQFNGKWNITVNADMPRGRAWWLEVTGAGTDQLKGRFMGTPGGQLEEIPKLGIFDGELRFAFERRYRREGKHTTQRGLYWTRIDNGKLKGTFEIEGDPSTYLEWTGVRAPALPDKDDGAWRRGEPIQLFNGKDVSGWVAQPAGKPHNWTVKDGLLTNAFNSTDLSSDRKCFNFDLHVEYQIGSHSNSGVALRGRYEVQILDDFGELPSKLGSGAVYGRILPKFNASRMTGEWQSLDIRLIGRQISVTHNGIRIIEKATIDGPTTIAQDALEAEPGPIVLQGDRGPVQFRKITLYPLSNAPLASLPVKPK